MVKLNVVHSRPLHTYSKPKKTNRINLTHADIYLHENSVGPKCITSLAFISTCGHHYALQVFFGLSKAMECYWTCRVWGLACGPAGCELNP